MSKAKNLTSRRQFLQATGGLAVGSIMPRIANAGYHNDVNDEIRVALVGCGGRGSGAALNAIKNTSGPCRLVAMADVFEDRLDASFSSLAASGGDAVDVPDDRKFLGFDAYKQAMDELRPGDVVILTTPPAFRWVHYSYAIEKKLNVFMEKPVTVDGPSSRKMLELNKKAIAAGLKVGVGLMSRHTIGLQELHARIQDGEIGDITMMRGYRMHGPAATSQSTKKPPTMTDLEYQIRRFHSFIWASGGCFNDFYIHHIDHLCWMKNAWPIKAQALGGKHYKENRNGEAFVDQNFDSYAVEYTFEDGTKFLFDGRIVDGAWGHFSSYVHGTKGVAIAARAGDFSGPQATHKGHVISSETEIWRSKDRSNPYQNEWNVLVQKIRDNEPHNEVETGINATLTSTMGRFAAHTGQEVTFDQMLNHDVELAPQVADLMYSSDAPVMPDEDGFYPVPKPGILTDREY
jgi:predicted dehydrogenase